MELRPLTLRDLPGLDALALESEEDGHRFLRRLQRECGAESDYFDSIRTVMFGVFADAQLVAVGGLTPDPYLEAPDTGRVRHVYVARAYRRRGVGRQLITAIERRAQGVYSRIRLRTDTAVAAAFYESLGFSPITSDTATHARDLAVNRRELLHEVAGRIASVSRAHPVRVAIDGIDAAGKTTFADELLPQLARYDRQIIRASVDGFHHPRAVRRRRGSTSPEGYYHDSFNYPALVSAILDPLGPGGSGEFRRAAFDFRTDAAVDAPLERAAANAILLFDGVFLLRPELRSHFDFAVFLRVDFSVSVQRAEVRDVQLFGSADEVRRRYRERYVPGQELYFSTVDPERWASVVIDNNDPSAPAIVQPASPADKRR